MKLVSKIPKQALLLVALASVVIVSAHEGCNKSSLVEASTIENFISKNVTVSNAVPLAASLIISVILYKYIVDGGAAGNPGVEWSNEEESDFMKYGTSFPTNEQKLNYARPS